MLCIGFTASSQMRDLTHERRALPVHALGKLLEIGDASIVAYVQLLKHIGTVRRDIRRTTEHGERNTALGFFLVIALVTFPGQPAFFEAAGMAGAHDAVAQIEMLQPKRLKKRIVLGSPDLGPRLISGW